MTITNNTKQFDLFVTRKEIYARRNKGQQHIDGDQCLVINNRGALETFKMRECRRK